MTNRITRRSLVVGAVLAPVFASGATAKKRKRKHKGADPLRELMANLARHHVHGLQHLDKTTAELVAMVDRGDVIEVQCGNIAAVAVSIAERAGYAARIVGSVTRDAFTGIDDGHTLLEVWDRGRWNLFDIDTNRRAIHHKTGAGVGIAYQCAAHEDRAWDILAEDALVRPDFEAVWRPLAERLYGYWVFDDLSRWYEHILGTPTMLTPDLGWVFADAADAERVESLGYVRISEEEWERRQEKPE